MFCSRVATMSTPLFQCPICAGSRHGSRDMSQSHSVMFPCLVPPMFLNVGPSRTASYRHIVGRVHVKNYLARQLIQYFKVVAVQFSTLNGVNELISEISRYSVIVIGSTVAIWGALLSD